MAKIIMDYETEFKKLCGDREDLIEDIKILNDEVNLYNNENCKLKLEKEKFEKGNAELLIKLFDKNNEIETITKRNAILFNKNKDQETEIEKLEKLNNILHSRIELNGTNFENLKKEIAILILKNSDKNKEIDAYIAEINILKRLIKILKSKWYVKLFHREKKLITKPPVSIKLDGDFYNTNLGELWSNKPKKSTPPDGGTGESE